tara:strand:+ start:617 stop:1507 length:891 start_codon:yes stop_codon:yes gene_type:complete
MASQVDGTVPVAGSPTTVSVKNNFAAARDELSCYLRTSKDFATSSGTGVAYTATFSVPAAKVAGERVTVFFHVSNTGPATININGTGSADIKVFGGATLAADMIKIGAYHELMWNAVDSHWELINPFPVQSQYFTSSKTISLTGDVTGQVSTTFGPGTPPAIATTLADNAGLKAYPTGAIYITTSNENPATTFGGGTWVKFGAGKVLMAEGGVGSQYTLGTSHGNYTHTLTAAQSGLPAHSHTQRGGGYNGSIGIEAGANLNSSLGETSTVEAQGAAESFSLLQPSIVVAMWQRTS